MNADETDRLSRVQAEEADRQARASTTTTATATVRLPNEDQAVDRRRDSLTTAARMALANEELSRQSL